MIEACELDQSLNVNTSIHDQRILKLLFILVSHADFVLYLLNYGFVKKEEISPKQNR